MSAWPLVAPDPAGEVAPARDPSFSVIVAAYQAAETIGEAIESTLAQTRAPLEIVVCDDGSTDDLSTALAPFGSRVRLLYKEHGGEGSAKNAAARAASGDFVVILDADDTFLPERLEALAQLARARPDLDILTTDAYLEAGGRRVRRVYSAGWTFETADQRRGILQRNFVFGHAAVRRERLLAAGGFDESILWTTDWDCWLRMILDGSAAGAVMEPLALYRVREQSLSARRADLLKGKIATLAKARGNPALQGSERSTLEHALCGYRRELELADLTAAAAGDRIAVRRRALALASAPRVAVRSRMTAAAIALSPVAAGGFRRARAAREWVGTGGVRVLRAGRSRPPLRVALYSDSRDVGGAERSLANLLAELAPRVRPTVLGVQADVVAAIAAGRPDVPTRVLPFIDSRRDVAAILAHVRALAALRPDVLHVNLFSPWGAQIALLLGELAPRVRVVAVEQLPQPPGSERQRRTKRLLARRLDAHVAVGRRSAREVEAALELPTGAVRTIYNGVPDVAVQRSRAFGARPTVGTLSRLEPQKGIDVLLRSLALLPDVAAVVAGDGSERGRLTALAGELDLASRLRWAGWSDEARAGLGGLDVFVLPSRFEGFPLAVVEAMLARLPVVATDVGSVAEAVVHGETGLLVPRDDPQGLAAAIRSLVDRPDERERLGAAGRERALALFTAERMAREFEALYEELFP